MIYRQANKDKCQLLLKKLIALGLGIVEHRVNPYFFRIGGKLSLTLVALSWRRVTLERAPAKEFGVTSIYKKLGIF